MLKAIATTTVLFLLCAPALADEATYRIDFGASTLFVTDNMCAQSTVKTRDTESTLKVCAKPVDGKRVRLDVERRVRDKTDEKWVSGALIASPGTSYDLLDAKLTFKLQS